MRPGNSRRLGIGVVGCGLVLERYHLPAILRSADWRVLSSADVLPGRREWARRAVSGAEAFESLTDLLRASPVDAVLIATPPATHSRLAIEALAAGRHVLVEKPLALIVGEAGAVEAAAAASGRRVAVGFNRRFRRAYVGLKERLRGLPPGSLRSVRCELVADAGRWPSVDRRSSEAGADLTEVLHDVVSHQLDLLSWLTGMSLCEVRAEEARDPKREGTFVSFEARLEGGIEASGVAGRARFYSERLEAEVPGRKLVALPGRIFEASRADDPGPWARAAGRIVGLARGAAHRIGRLPGAAGESFEKQLEAFAAAIRGDEAVPPGADAACGVRAVRAVEACRRSLEAGGAWIRLEPTMEGAT